jgi:DNA-binding NtrC family response regulator
MHMASPESPLLLIVDDEVNVTRTLQLVFERHGYRVKTALSCADALKKLGDDDSIDAVITDLNMEREDIGLNVARAARKLKSKPAVIICTGYASVSNSQSALEMHVDYLAIKPVDLEQLLSAVHRLIALRTSTKNGGAK